MSTIPSIHYFRILPFNHEQWDMRPGLGLERITLISQLRDGTVDELKTFISIQRTRLVAFCECFRLESANVNYARLA